MKNEPQKPRVTVFGMGHMGQVVCVKPPKADGGVGLYVHVEDFEKYKEWCDYLRQENEPKRKRK